MVMIGMIVGSILGSMIMGKLGFGSFSFMGIVGSTAGGIAGIWAFFKLTE